MSAAPDETRLDVPADLRYLGVVGAALQALLATVLHGEDGEATAYNITLAVHEICTNVIEHAYAGQPGRVMLRFRLTQAPALLEVWIEDTGRAFDPNTVPPPDMSALEQGGMGLFLTHELMDSVQYSAGDTGNCWTLTKSLA